MSVSYDCTLTTLPSVEPSTSSFPMAQNNERILKRLFHMIFMDLLISDFPITFTLQNERICSMTNCRGLLAASDLYARMIHYFTTDVEKKAPIRARAYRC